MRRRVCSDGSLIKARTLIKTASLVLVVALATAIGCEQKTAPRSTSSTAKTTADAPAEKPQGPPPSLTTPPFAPANNTPPPALDPNWPPARTSSQPIPRQPLPRQTTPAAPVSTAPAVRADQSIRIGSFNVQVFGASKMSDPKVVNVLVGVVRKFDVLAIQELRAKDDTIIPKFVDLINSSGVRYDAVVGPRLGRTNSKEQYVFIYNTDRITLERDKLFTVSDPQDALHREPLVGCFRVKGLPPGRAFSFALADIHTDPDEADMECDALGDAYPKIGPYLGEDDVILLGDLNTSAAKLGKLGRVPGIAAVIPPTTPTNTRRTKSYDNMLFIREATAEFLGGGVLDLEAEFGLAPNEALAISDHLPIWAEFSAVEASGANVATQPGQPVGR